MKSTGNLKTDRFWTYFVTEKKPLLIVTVSGLIYNLGLVASPWFVGKLAQCLLDIYDGKKDFPDMVKLATAYALAILLVQGARYVKRFYVRRFANDINRNMKHVIYGNLIHKEKTEIVSENVGSIMTKAISDVEACAEGMRKFTTEIFDTGVVMVGYISYLLFHDWKLTLLCLIFPPISYIIAERMKTVVHHSNAIYKESSGRLSAATLDRVQGVLTYRVFGCEDQRDADYETYLEDYEKKAIYANIWVSCMHPLYRALSQTSTIFILYFGARNVMGCGFTAWDVAAFTSFFTCYNKLANKSSRAAKLFNAVQKAQVSWARIQPLMKEVPEDREVPAQRAEFVRTENLGFGYPGSREEASEGKLIYKNLSFEASQGTVIGVTGPVACGKTTLGKTFLCEYPYEGSIQVDGRELAGLPVEIQHCLIGYLGHDPEILSASIYDNIAMGEAVDVEYWLQMVCLDEEVRGMPEGVNTLVGSGGIRLSGGQQQRLALARTLAHYRPVLVLDDPFSALDRNTELEVFKNLKTIAGDRVILLLSHRLYLFPEFDRVIWMNDGKCTVSDHRTLMADNPEYAHLYDAQVKNAEEGGTL